MNQEEKEVTINISDMCAELLHRWKMIVLFGIVGMILVGGIMSYRDYKGIKSKFEENTYSSMMENLNENQKNNALQYYSRYKTYQERIADNQKYLDDSFKMNLDPNDVSVYTVEYLVKTGYQGIMYSITSSALDLDDYEKIAAILGNSEKVGYVSEVVELGGSVQQDAYDIDTDKVGDVVNGNISYSYTGLLTLTIKGKDRETCEKVAEVVDAAIKEHIEKLKGAKINVELSGLTSSYIKKQDLELAEYQRSQVEAGSKIVEDYYKFVTDAKKTLDEDEVRLFEYLIDKDQDENDTVHWKKWAAAGLAAGAVVAISIILVNYLFIPGIKTPDDAYLITEEKEMGIVIQPSKSRIFLGKLFHNWAKNIEFHGVTQLPDTESIPLMCDRIAGICNNNNTKNVYMIYDTEGYTKDVIEKCKSILIEKGFSVKAGNPGSSSEDFKALAEADNTAAVLVMTNKRSLPDTIRKNIDVCKEKSVKIIGNFIVSPQR